MSDEAMPPEKYNLVIREIIELERSYFFEKRNVNTERRRKLRDLIERHTNPGNFPDDT
jgi:hypothetical protein